MLEPSGALSVAAAGLAVPAIALTRLGPRQPGYRGWRFWVSALWLTAAALALMATGIHGPAPWLPAFALLTPWPLLTLIGLRRFNARDGLPAHERIDWAVLAGCTASALAGDLLSGATSSGALLRSGAVLVSHAYAAAIMWSAHRSDDAPALRLLGTVVILSALTPALPMLAGMPPAMAQGLAAAFGLAVMSFATLTMMSERTERELRHSRRRLRVLANTDPLTGVPNRRRFNELVARSRAEVEAGSALLLIFDIDHFKMINDKLGHAAGDRALQLVGRCMNEALRAGDVAGRLGGDEFALLLRGATLEQALGVASRIVTQLQVQSPDLHLPCLGLSFGIAEVQGDEALEDALARADAALYEAKRQGRSRAVAASGDDERPAFTESRRLGLTPL